MAEGGGEMRSIEIYDTTLRDGAQGEGVSYSVADKLNVATALDALGVRYIEAGNPGSNPKDAEFFEAARGKRFYAKLVAFGSTRRRGCSCGEDKGCAALLLSLIHI